MHRPVEPRPRCTSRPLKSATLPSLRLRQPASPSRHPPDSEFDDLRVPGSHCSKERAILLVGLSGSKHGVGPFTPAGSRAETSTVTRGMGCGRDGRTLRVARSFRSRFVVLWRALPGAVLRRHHRVRKAQRADTHLSARGTEGQPISLPIRSPRKTRHVPFDRRRHAVGMGHTLD